MKHQNMYSRIMTLNQKFNKENYELTKFSNKSKFEALRKWSIDNGSIFQETIDFPIKYGPFGYDGVKSKREIQDNEAILFIPRKQMIISKDYEHLFSFLYDNKEEKEDRSNIVLTLALIIEEEKGNESFYKPYLDILPDNDFIILWTKSDLEQLDDEKMIDSVNMLCYEINDEYKKIVSNSKFKHLSKDKFIFFYSHVQSREFYIDDMTSALVPLAELFNHDTVKTRYEFYDSENMVFKNTVDLCGNTNDDIQPTMSPIWPKRDISYDPYKEIHLKIDLKKHEEEEDDSNKVVLLDKNDFFVFATSTSQFFHKGEQLFLNYSKLTNKSALLHYGFNMLVNKYDSTVFYFEFAQKEKELLKISFPKHLKFDDKPNKILLKVKIKYRKICEILLKYFRFMHFTNKDDYYLYSFSHEIEYKIICNSIDYLSNQLELMEKKHSIESDLTFLEGDSMTPRQMNYTIYRLRRKINVAHQIELLKAIKFIMEKHQLKDYFNILEYIDELSNISEYEVDKDCISKIMIFILSQKVQIK